MANRDIPVIEITLPGDEAEENAEDPETNQSEAENESKTPEGNCEKEEEEEKKIQYKPKHNGTLRPEDRPTLSRRRALRHQKIVSGMLEPLEMKFVQSIRRRDIKGVEASMEADPGLLRLEDHYGVSALEHAVMGGSVEIVEKLLEKSLNPMEKQQAIERAMLFGIKYNNIKMVDRLIDLHQDLGACKVHNLRLQQGPGKKCDGKLNLADLSAERKVTRSSLRSSPSLDMFSEDAEFSQDISPMVLAAQLNRTEIIEMLHNRCCPNIHPVTKKDCLNPEECLVCHHQVTFIGRQSIEECRQALDVFKALSSPAYMFHTGTEDPLLESFVISDLMNRRMAVDPAYGAQYAAIGKECRTFSSTLLSLCRTVDEVQTLFGITDGIEMTHRTKFHQARFPRLLLAIYFNQKEFVAHPNCQQVMQLQWYQGLPDWVCKLNLHRLRLALYFLMLFIFLPVIFILYMFRVQFIERFVKPAANKFILDSCSFIYFLIMLFCKVSLGVKLDKGGTFGVLDCFIFIWVIGLTVRYAKMYSRRRDSCTCYMFNAENSNWRVFELLNLTCFWLHFLLVFGILIHKQISGEEIPSRTEMDGNAALLWAEIFGAIACTLTASQVYSFFKISSVLGPLQVSLKKMMLDVLKFMILFLVVLSAFAIGLAFLYSGYKGVSAIDPNTGDRLEQEDHFTSLQDAYKRLFWDLFNYGGEENADLVVGNDGTYTMINKTNTTKMVITMHRTTEIFGYIMYGIYHVTVIVVLLNMLIAMMANSYNNVEANADTEWKFARTRLFMYYFNEVGVLCPPFNLLPLRALLAFLGKKFTKCHIFKRARTKQRQYNPKALMERLRKRYYKFQVARKKLQRASADLSLTKDVPGTPLQQGSTKSLTTKPEFTVTNDKSAQDSNVSALDKDHSVLQRAVYPANNNPDDKSVLTISDDGHCLSFVA